MPEQTETKQQEDQTPALMEKMFDVESSYISKIGHSDEHQTLAVEFSNGKSFYYPEFSAEDFAKFRFADSVGKHFHLHIKNQFDCKAC